MRGRWGPSTRWRDIAICRGLLLETVVVVVQVTRESYVNLGLVTTAATAAHKDGCKQKSCQCTSKGSQEAEPREADYFIRYSGYNLSGAWFLGGFWGLSKLTKRVAGIEQEAIGIVEGVVTGGMVRPVLTVV